MFHIFDPMSRENPISKLLAVLMVLAIAIVTMGNSILLHNCESAGSVTVKALHENREESIQSCCTDIKPVSCCDSQSSNISCHAEPAESSDCCSDEITDPDLEPFHVENAVSLTHFTVLLSIVSETISTNDSASPFIQSNLPDRYGGRAIILITSCFRI